jgi:hypothetical protein
MSDLPGSGRHFLSPKFCLLGAKMEFFNTHA